MANRALTAKMDRARKQVLELGHMEGTKALYLTAPSKQELRDMLAAAQANTTKTLRVKMLATRHSYPSINQKRGNADMGARRDLISSGSPASHIQDIKRERRERPIVRWGAHSVAPLYRNGVRVG